MAVSAGEKKKAETREETRREEGLWVELGGEGVE